MASWIDILRLHLSATRTAYVLGKFEGDPSKVSLDEIAEIDLQFIEEYRDSHDEI